MDDLNEKKIEAPIQEQKKNSNQNQKLIEIAINAKKRSEELENELRVQRSSFKDETKTNEQKKKIQKASEKKEINLKRRLLAIALKREMVFDAEVLSLYVDPSEINLESGAITNISEILDNLRSDKPHFFPEFKLKIDEYDPKIKNSKETFAHFEANGHNFSCLGDMRHQQIRLSQLAQFAKHTRRS